jgi:type IV secretion system protein VirB6
MEPVNFVGQILGNIDELGTAFTTATYGALAAQMSPILAGFFVIYLIFWGFQYWQGYGETNLPRFVFRLFRVAIIFSMATSWGSIQTFTYDLVRQAPAQISGVLLANIVNAGQGAMSTGTIDRDLFDYYNIGSSVLNPLPVAPQNAASSTPQNAETDPNAPTPAAGQTNASPPPTVASTTPRLPSPVLNAATSLGLVPLLTFVAGALFIGSAIAIIIFAKLSLWICLSLAPIFIALLMFRAPSRYFSGWANVLVQAIVIPIFLYGFLAFYFIGVKDVVITLVSTVNRGEAITLDKATPFILVSLCGMFLVAKILPLAKQLSADTQAMMANATSAASATTQRFVTSRQGGAPGRGLAQGGLPNGSEFGDSSANAYEAQRRELQQRQNAARHQRQNL